MGCRVPGQLPSSGSNGSQIAHRYGNGILPINGFRTQRLVYSLVRLGNNDPPRTSDSHISEVL
jgi:hypothetical protein